VSCACKPHSPNLKRCSRDYRV